MARSWSDHWQVVSSTPARSGGQGAIQHVVALEGRREGALKVLHDDGQSRRERRFRLKEEVNALSALTFGVPKLLDSNASEAADEDPLFLVMEWIPGPSLAQKLSARPMAFDDALVCCTQILRTLGSMHRLPIVHRDLKPDNVILRDGLAANPVIVDFGLAWDESQAEREFHSRGQDMGNRFLRLPEYAPGRDSHHARSDVCLAAGLLFNMLVGRAPRILRDEHGRAPHESMSDAIPNAVKGDVRWPRLARVFTRAFQTELALRFQSAEELADALSHLAPSVPEGDVLFPALERLAADMESSKWRTRIERQTAIGNLGGRFDQHLRSLLANTGLGLPGHHGFDSQSRTYNSNIGLQAPGAGGVTCSLHHGITIADPALTATYGVHGGRGDAEYYRGSIVDLGGLEEAMWASPAKMVALAIDAFRDNYK
jgi:serine/threonine protein kinase